MVEASNALSWAHQLACVKDPTQCLLVKQVLEGAKRILAHRTQKKEPITPAILEQLVSKFAGKEASLSDIRIIAICLIGFAGFLRFNQIANLKESDLMSRFSMNTWNCSLNQARQTNTVMEPG